MLLFKLSGIQNKWRKGGQIQYFLLKFTRRSSMNSKMHYFMRNVMHYFEINANGGLGIFVPTVTN